MNSQMTTKPASSFDQAVGAEADQRDRAGGDAGAERDRELDDVPGVPAPGQQARSALKPSALSVTDPRKRRAGLDEWQWLVRAHWWARDSVGVACFAGF